jgi:hypothetical protein
MSISNFHKDSESKLCKTPNYRKHASLPGPTPGSEAASKNLAASPGKERED